MAGIITHSGPDLHRGEILTLAEAAAYLRVDIAAVEQLVADQAIPARKIGGEWRFLKRALDDWLSVPGHQPHVNGMPEILLEELLAVMEKRLLQRLRHATSTTPRPGSKEAVLKHVGIFSEDEDLEERLADIRARREAGG